MYTDFIPIPSKGRFYPLDKYGNYREYLEVAYLTTEDEIMMTSPNLFAKGDTLYRLLENKVLPYNKDLEIDDLLVNDKDFILLWLRENAYGNVIDYVDNDERFVFDTHSINITYLKDEPDENQLYSYVKGDYNIKIKLLTIFNERVNKSKNNSKLDYYASHIVNFNGTEDYERIKNLLARTPILVGRDIKKYIDQLNFGVAKEAYCFINNERTKTPVEINELFFGFTASNLSKNNKMLNDNIFYLLNEGQGYTNSDILNMPTHTRLYNIEKLSDKNKRLNDEMNQK